MPIAQGPAAPFGLAANQVFSPLGWIKPAGATEPLLIAEGGVPFAWSQALGRYELTLPDVGTGHLVYTFPGQNVFAFSVIGSGGQKLTDAITLNDGKFYDPPMGSVGTLSWLRTHRDWVPGDVTFAYGLRTAASEVPTSGRRKYLTYESDGGTALLDVDFGAKTVGGFLGVAWVDAGGPYSPVRYGLSSVAAGADGTSFSARVIVPDAPTEGQLFVQYMGRGAHEVAIAWKAPIKNPYTNVWQITYGVLVGPICNDC